MTTRRIQVCVIIAAVVFCAGYASAQEETEGTEPATDTTAEIAEEAPPTTNFEGTVDFNNLQKTALDGAVGEVQVQSVEFVTSNVKSGGISGAFSSADTEVQGVITTTISCAAKTDTKWKLDFMVEFLDEDGNVIDRTTSNGSLKKNKSFDFKHTTLRWAIGHIKQARVSVAAK